MSGIMVSHGTTAHSIDAVEDCETCIQVNLDWFELLKKVGGKSKLKEALKNKRDFIKALSDN